MAPTVLRSAREIECAFFWQAIPLARRPCANLFDPRCIPCPHRCPFTAMPCHKRIRLGAGLPTRTQALLTLRPLIPWGCLPPGSRATALTCPPRGAASRRLWSSGRPCGGLARDREAPFFLQRAERPRRVPARVRLARGRGDSTDENGRASGRCSDGAASCWARPLFRSALRNVMWLGLCDTRSAAERPTRSQRSSLVAAVPLCPTVSPRPELLLAGLDWLP